MNFVIFLVALGAVLRLTRLAVADTITQTFRTRLSLRYAAASALESQTLQSHQHSDSPVAQRVMRRLSRRRAAWLWLVQLFECPWCIGFWISLVVAAVALSPAASSVLVAWPAIALSLSWLVGALAFLEATIEDVHHRLD